MNKIGIWAMENKCELNEEKTKIVLVRKSLRDYPENEFIRNFEIVKSFKYLGIYLDSSLTFNK